MGAIGMEARRAPIRDGAPPERLAALTRLRAVLILWVLVYHLELPLRAFAEWPVTERVALKGYLGVDGFFILSGFALFLGYRHRPPLGLAGWGDFALRRAARIFPLHLAALALLVVIVMLAMAAGARVNDPQRFGLWELLTQALLVHAWETTSVHAWNYPSWALSAIWAGYLLFPPLLTAMLGRGVGTCWVLILACLGGLAWLGMTGDGAQLNRTLHLGLLRFGLEFVLGIALAKLVTAREIGAGTASSLALVAIPLGLTLDLDVLVVAGLAALVARLGMEAPGKAPPSDLLWRLGEASFGVYLSWVFVEAALVAVLRLGAPGPAGRMALVVGGLAASAALGWLAWKYVELPAARRIARLMRR